MLRVACGRTEPPTPTPDMARPEGFTFEHRKSGEVVIRHHGRVAAALRGKKAEKFLRDVDASDTQRLMARLTGNYKRRHERR